jgi:hypothetical protein
VVQLREWPHADAAKSLGRNCHMPSSLQTPLHVVVHMEHLAAQAAGKGKSEGEAKGVAKGSEEEEAPAEVSRCVAACVCPSAGKQPITAQPHEHLLASLVSPTIMVSGRAAASHPLWPLCLAGWPPQPTWRASAWRSALAAAAPAAPALPARAWARCVALRACQTAGGPSTVPARRWLRLRRCWR